MSKREILESLFNDSSLRKKIEQYAGDDSADILQEIFLSLQEMPDETIIDLQASNKLTAYVLGMLWKMSKSPNDKIYKQTKGQRKNTVELINDNFPDDDGDHQERLIDRMNHALKFINPADLRIIMLYAELGTYKAVSQALRPQLKLSVNTVSCWIKRIQQDLKTKIRKDEV